MLKTYDSSVFNMLVQAAICRNAEAAHQHGTMIVLTVIVVLDPFVVKTFKLLLNLHMPMRMMHVANPPIALSLHSEQEHLYIAWFVPAEAEQYELQHHT